MRVRQIERTREAQRRARSMESGRLEKKMKDASDVFATRHFEGGAIRHRLSWFATLQGLLFLYFVLVDKDDVGLITTLVCVGVAMCLPSIASTYARSRFKNWVRVLLAVFWVSLGVAHLLRSV